MVNLYSVAFNGIDAIEVKVQIHIASGLPNFIIVGLPDKTIAESKERVKAAISSIGISLPPKKIVVNLSPADLLKEGSHFDLPIACALLSSYDILPKEEMQQYLILGELGLDGNMMPITGALPAAIQANRNGKGVILPKQNAEEALWSGNKNIIAANDLLSIINHFKGSQVISYPEQPYIEKNLLEDKKNIHDLANIKGHKIPKRAIEIAAAGGHNLLMFGPPGSGKSILAQSVPGLLSEMDHEEVLESSMVLSIAGLLQDGKLTKQRPFRAPHHSCSVAAMVGGGIGKRVKPGEISLAHNGILFLDELPEFSSNVLDSLRQPIETGHVTISRSGYQVKYPSDFQLIAAMNPCKCGYIADARRACSRAPICARDYLRKISGPIMDRFDIQIEVPFVSNFIDYKEEIETSEMVAKRVNAARKLQYNRYKGLDIKINKQLSGEFLDEFAMPQDIEGKNLLREVVEKFSLSMRSCNKILKLARTIADISNSEKVNKMHIAEAISYRYSDNILRYSGG